MVDPRNFDIPQQATTWRDSPKIIHLVSDLNIHLASDQNGKTAKAVVFSQWTEFLNIVGVALRHKGIDFEPLDGSRSLNQRKRSLARMRNQPEVKVLLGTVGAGGVGIDLKFAQKVYLMEPCWNPSVENQATDRAYCLGQNCITEIIRYFIEGSIEVNMMEIQKRKKELAKYPT